MLPIYTRCSKTPKKKKEKINLKNISHLNALWYHFISLLRWCVLRHRSLVRRIRALRSAVVVAAAVTAVAAAVHVVDVVVVSVGHCQCKRNFVPPLLDAVLQAVQAALHAIEISLDNVEMGLEVVQK